MQFLLPSISILMTTERKTSRNQLKYSDPWNEYKKSDLSCLKAPFWQKISTSKDAFDENMHLLTHTPPSHNDLSNWL